MTNLVFTVAALSLFGGVWWHRNQINKKSNKSVKMVIYHYGLIEAYGNMTYHVLSCLVSIV